MGEEFQREGTATMDRKAVHPKWLSPLSLCVHFGKDFALKSGLYRLIFCEGRIIICKVQKHRLNQDFTVQNKSNICVKKKFVQKVSPAKKFLHKQGAKKKNSCKLKNSWGAMAE